MSYRPVMVSRGGNPFEIMMMVASILVGLSLIFLSTRPRSVAIAMPGIVQVLWEVGLIFGGVVGLIGVSWRGQLSTKLGTELAGIFILGATLSMYGTALYAVSGLQALAAGSFVTAFAAASWWRAVQIICDLGRVGRAAERGKTADIHLLVEEQP